MSDWSKGFLFGIFTISVSYVALELTGASSALRASGYAYGQAIAKAMSK